MVSKKDNKPSGFGRSIPNDKKWFMDGQFENGDSFGYVRSIERNGTYKIEHYDKNNKSTVVK